MVEASAQTNAWIKFLMHTAECVFTGHHWSRGATDNASDYGSEDCRFESCRARNENFFQVSPFFYLRFVIIYYPKLQKYPSSAVLKLRI